MIDTCRKCGGGIDNDNPDTCSACLYEIATGRSYTQDVNIAVKRGITLEKFHRERLALRHRNVR